MPRTVLARLVGKIFSHSFERHPPQRSPRPGVTFRPRVEALEAREVPAQYWVGDYSTNFSDPNNWHLTEYGDEYFFYGAEYYEYNEPFYDEYGEIRPLGGSCDLPADSYNYIEISFEYPGTITLSGPTSANYFYLSSGTVDQLSASADLTILYDFGWSGGTLNSTNNLADVILDGAALGEATGHIAPAGGGTVNLGSNITLMNGAVMTAYKGTLNLLNDGWQFNINTNSVLNVNPGGGFGFNVDANFPIINGVQINMRPTTWVKVISGTWLNMTPLKNEGGSFILESGTLASFGGRVDNENNGPSIKQTSGAIYIAADAGLGNTRGMLMSGGAIVQKSGPKPAGFAGNIRSGGDLTILGGEIRFEHGFNNGYEFGEFLVNGDVIWKGGTFKPYVCSESTNYYDQWHVMGGMMAINTPNGTAAIEPTAVDLVGFPSTPAVGMTWEILKSDNGFANNNKPTFDNNTWALDPVGVNPVTIWKLRKT